MRDALIAALLGAGPAADAFLLAFQSINVARRLLSEGSLNAALIPAYLRIRDETGGTAAAAFAGRVLGTVTLALVGVATVFGLAMPWAIAWLAPGFVGHPQYQLAIDDARLMLPYLAFVGPVAVVMGLLNVAGRFTFAAFSPVLFNLTLIAVAIGLLAWRGQDAGFAAFVLAASVGIAGCLQAIVLAFPGKTAARPIRVAFDADMLAFLRRALPGTVAQLGPQLLIVAAAVIASASPAAVAWLYFASRLIELPLGIVGTVVGSVLLPAFTRAVRGDDRQALAAAQSRALELAMGLALPAAIGLAVLAEPIVRLLFEHGAFTAQDTHNTAIALALLAIGLPGHVAVKMLAPAFFARENTTQPLLATLAGLAAATLAAILLQPRYGYAGVAAAMAFGAWSSAAALGSRLALTYGILLDSAARGRLSRIALANILLGLALAAANDFADATHQDFWDQTAWLGCMIGFALALYVLLLRLLKVVTSGGVLAALRRSG
jgi:putative peptidoglycan lipid II flippase